MSKRARHRDENTADLFEHARLFPVETPREFGSALDFNAALATAMSRALDEAREHGRDRYEVARRMSEILHIDISKGMLDAYTSVNRPDHTISAVRFKAFVRATGCVWLWTVYLDGEGLTILQGQEALHAQASLAEKRARALLDEARQLRAQAPLHVSRGRR